MVQISVDGNNHDDELMKYKRVYWAQNNVNEQNKRRIKSIYILSL